MTKYKHKTTGFIATPINKGWYEIDSNDDLALTVPSWMIESSEDWEQVKEKGFEILSFIGLIDSHVYHRDDRDKTFYQAENGAGGTQKNMLANPNNGINAVRRKEDSEVFTKNDYVTHDRQKAQITDFLVDEDVLGGLLVRVRFLRGVEDCGVALSNIVKMEPEFITEDNKPVFEWVWYVDTDLRGDAYKPHLTRLHRDSIHPYPVCKYFSTEEAAWEWCIEHKPMFSIELISDLLDLGNDEEAQKILRAAAKHIVKEGKAC